MLVEQFLHIMLNQDDPRFLCFFSTANIYIFALRYIRENGKYEKKLCKRLQSHRLNPLNNARFPMSYAVLNLTFLRLPL